MSRECDVGQWPGALSVTLRVATAEFDILGNVRGLLREWSCCAEKPDEHRHLLLANRTVRRRMFKLHCSIRTI